MAWVDTGVTGQVGYWLRARSGAGRGRAKWALRASYSKCVPAPRDSPRFSTLLFWLSPPPPRVSLTARGPDLPVREELSLPERIKDGLGGSHRGRVGRGGSGRSRPQAGSAGRGRGGPRWAAVRGRENLTSPSGRPGPRYRWAPPPHRKQCRAGRGCVRGPSPAMLARTRPPFGSLQPRIGRGGFRCLQALDALASASLRWAVEAKGK